LTSSSRGMPNDAIEGVAIGDLIELVAAGDVLHCPVCLGRLCEGDPRRHDIGRAEAPIGRVLVPRHEGRIARLLDEELGGPHSRAGPCRSSTASRMELHRTSSASQATAGEIYWRISAVERPARPLLERLEPPPGTRSFGSLNNACYGSRRPQRGGQDLQPSHQFRSAARGAKRNPNRVWLSFRNTECLCSDDSKSLPLHVRCKFRPTAAAAKESKCGAR
jgi:hypothetical protein